MGQSRLGNPAHLCQHSIFTCIATTNESHKWYQLVSLHDTAVSAHWKCKIREVDSTTLYGPSIHSLGNTSILCYKSVCASLPPSLLELLERVRSELCYNMLGCTLGIFLVTSHLFLLRIVVAHVYTSWTWWGGWLEKWRKAMLQPTSTEKCTTISVE